MGLDVDTVKRWEQGRRNPNTISRVLMILMDRDASLIETLAEITGADMRPAKRGRPRK